MILWWYIYEVFIIQVMGGVRNEKLQLQFDKRMTGSTAIDEVLHEVCCAERYIRALMNYNATSDG